MLTTSDLASAPPDNAPADPDALMTHDMASIVTFASGSLLDHYSQHGEWPDHASRLDQVSRWCLHYGYSSDLPALPRLALTADLLATHFAQYQPRLASRYAHLTTPHQESILIEIRDRSRQTLIVH